MRFYIGGSIRNRKIKNLITIGVGMALVLLLCLYFGTRSGYEKQLNEFAATVPIRCQVTNISGSRETGLFISDRMVQGVMESDLTKEVTCMVWLMAGEGEFEPEDLGGEYQPVCGWSQSSGGSARPDGRSDPPGRRDDTGIFLLRPVGVRCKPADLRRAGLEGGG